MSYVLYSTPIETRHGTLMVPPISMYHLRKILELKSKGINIDNPDAAGAKALEEILVEVIQENHPELTFEQFERNVDVQMFHQIMTAIQGIPKNVTPQIGTTTSPEAQNDQKKS